MLLGAVSLKPAHGKIGTDDTGIERASTHVTRTPAANVKTLPGAAVYTVRCGSAYSWSEF